MKLALRSTTTATALAMAVGLGISGVAAAAPAPAPASVSALRCDAPQYFSTQWNAGGSIRCTGGAFVARAVCFKPGYGNYTHYGNRVESGGTSTVWCDTNATVQVITGLAS
ncbi:hypothetical protein [Kitasatospora sp. NPDC047058]|uniref:hypothetical protein n=1 Tax=Kitasatospora sp. NPDC047058 TaxID=3155620 RepID=UPI00340A92C6